MVKRIGVFAAAPAIVCAFGVSAIPGVQAATSGGAWAWGSNFAGQLGNGGTSNSATPAVLSIPSGVTFTQVSAGRSNSSVALDSTGRAWGWGGNNGGQLGNGTTTDTTTPTVANMPAGIKFTTIAEGAFAWTLALDSSGRAWAWGNNTNGQLGNGTMTNSSVPLPVSMPTGVSFVAIAAGNAHALALDGLGNAWGWGGDDRGQTGVGYSTTLTNFTTPTAVAMPAGATFTSIAAGASHSLALDTQGRAWAWGDNMQGELGDNGVNGSTCSPFCSGAPLAVTMPSGVSFRALSGGSLWSLALDGGGQAWAWGYGGNGELGNGGTAGSSSPAAVTTPAGVTFSVIAAGDSHALALESSGQAWAWGYNSTGQLGDGVTGGVSTVPASVIMPAGVSFSSVAGGAGHSLALEVAADTDLSIGTVSDISTSATNASGASVMFTLPSSTDESGETPSVTCDHNSGDTFPVGTTKVTCSATDSDDNPSSVKVSFKVTVTDADLALHGWPANITTNPTGPSGATVSYTPPTASDEGGQTPTVNCTPASGSTFAIGITTVSCSASASDADDANSPVGVSFTVTVRGALAQLQDLQTYVNGLPPGTSLPSKVYAAITYYQAGDMLDTCSELTQIINEAKAQTGKHLTAAQAYNVITAATRIRSVLGC